MATIIKNKKDHATYMKNLLDNNKELETWMNGEECKEFTQFMIKKKTDLLGFIDIEKYEQTQTDYYKKNLNLYAEVYLTIEKNRNFIREISDKEKNPQSNELPIQDNNM